MRNLSQMRLSLQQLKQNKWWLALGLLVLMAVFYRQILFSAGNWLIVEDEKEKVDAIFVLSGNSHDRGAEAARLFQEGWAPTVVCLGGETNLDLEYYGITEVTAMLTRRVLEDHGVPRERIELLPEGTSTYEEFEAIGRLCRDKGWKRIMVVSSLFHTRRIDTFFRLRLYFQGVDLVLRGASEGQFEEAQWWKSEPGLLFVTSEYIKMGWYYLRY